MKTITIAAICLGIGGECARRIFVLFQYWRNKYYTEILPLYFVRSYLFGFAFIIIASAIFLSPRIGCAVMGAVGLAFLIINVLHVFFPAYIVFPCVTDVKDKLEPSQTNSDNIVLYAYKTYSLLYVRIAAPKRLLAAIRECPANPLPFVISQLLMLALIFAALYQIMAALSLE